MSEMPEGQVSEEPNFKLYIFLLGHILYFHFGSVDFHFDINRGTSCVDFLDKLQNDTNGRLLVVLLDQF